MNFEILFKKRYWRPFGNDISVAIRLQHVLFQEIAISTVSSIFYLVLQNVAYHLYIPACPCSSVGRAIDL